MTQPEQHFESCPFCDEPLKERGYYDDTAGAWKAQYECGTFPGFDIEERTRTHMCYMNQIRALQTGGETDYSEGWHAGLEAAFTAMADARSSWKAKNPPMRKVGK